MDTDTDSFFLVKNLPKPTEHKIVNTVTALITGTYTVSMF